MSNANPKDDLKNLPFMNQDLDLEARVEDLLQRLTFEEKCLLSAGESENSPPPIPRLGIPQFKMADGPHGVSPGAVRNSPHFTDAIDLASSTYFPTGIQMGSTFDPDLVYKFGQALAEETRAAGRQMILGPAFNICRSPMNGRTFEYYSEDPYLAGEIAVAAVEGIQSKRVAACIKHYVANNQESNRFKVDAIIPERALEEIYYPAFRTCVQRADPWGAMSAYNKINGTYVSEHRHILREVLKERWGFSGVVVSDWGATRRCTGINELIAGGLDIEMGHRIRFQVEEMKALKDAGTFPEIEFEDNVRRILRAYFRVGLFDDPATIPEGSLNTPEHQAIARKSAEEGMVLLKNERDLLPLDISKVEKIAILGKHADLKFGRKKLGGGSSAVYPPYEITVRQGLHEKCQGKVEIVEDPAEADVAVVCVGLEHTHDFKGGDHEGSDKLRYSLGFFLPRLINKTAAKNKNTIVVCVNGSPFGMEKFVDNVPAILEAWYGGLEVGRVVADILFGDVNPSGKLPVSWPKRKKDIPTALSLVDTVIPVKEVRYDEGVFVGYRYYDAKRVPLRFCFGFGLSYTQFEYSDLKLSPKSLSGEQTLSVEFTLTNTGKRAGAEIAQLYIRDIEASLPRPEKELKGFKRIYLEPGTSQTVKFEIDKHYLAFFDDRVKEWRVEPGEFEILVGSSCQDIHLRDSLVYK